MIQKSKLIHFDTSSTALIDMGKIWPLQSANQDKITMFIIWLELNDSGNQSTMIAINIRDVAIW